ncbi:hypothetical protein [Enterococcus sp. AZ163]|uniref:hypothetical protein n=1 Tax=Enterococcus sp. AZ163 TaxID=2774638 RepID=UPI003D2C2C12
MGVNIDLHSYDYEPLLEGIKNYVGTEDTNEIDKILRACGSVIDGKYIILNNELWDGYSPYYNVAGALDRHFKSDDVFGEVFCTFDNKYGHENLINACDSPDEILEELNLGVH